MKRIYAWISCLVLCSLFMIAGCAVGPESDSDKICPGKDSIQDVIDIFEARYSKLHPMRVSVYFIIEGKYEDGKPFKEDVEAKLGFLPPDLLKCEGDKFGKIGYGTNSEFFWLMIEPEYDVYYWGSRDDAERCSEALPFGFNPWFVNEALGNIKIDSSWTLQNKKNYDLLQQIGPAGKVRKEIRIRTCDYRIESILVFESDQKGRIKIDLSEYITTQNGALVPKKIQVSHFVDGEVDAEIRIRLSKPKFWKVDPEKAQKSFKRPSSQYYDNVYQLLDTCEFLKTK